jgi:hypothetical protein
MMVAVGCDLRYAAAHSQEAVLRSNLMIALSIPLLALIGCGDKDTGDTTTDDTGDTDTTGGDAPDISVSANILDFGELTPGATSSLEFEIENKGNVNLNVSAISVSLPYVNVLSPPFMIIPNGVLTATVQCKPTNYSQVEYPDTLVISSDDPDEPTVSIDLRCDLLTDADNDGYETEDVGGTDCDDNDPDVYPGAPDEWYDGDDDNCDGADDYDQDGDGYQTIVWNSDPDAGGGDCQDANASIHPNGIDSTCDDANDYDQDGDGYSSQAAGFGSDCDDENPQINADNEEMLNAADDDCDGLIDWDVPGWNADAVWVGDAAEKAGYSFTTGDLDEDGYDDIVIGAPGSASNYGSIAVFDGSNLPADGDTIADGQNYYTETASAMQLGTTVAFFRDFKNNTSEPAVLIGAPAYSSSTGRIYAVAADDLFYGGDPADAYFSLTGSSTSQYVGRGIAQDLDLNADGVDDLMGTYWSSSSNYLYLLYGGVQGDYTLGDVDATYSTTGSHSNAYWSVPSGGDLNGDGYDDFVFCDSKAGSGGKVWVLWGGASRVGNDSAESIDTAGTAVVIGETYQQLGRVCGIGPDTNNDGAEELWFQVPDAAGIISGIYEIPGGDDLEDGDVDVTDSRNYSRRYEMRDSDPGAITFGRIGDWDDDGIGDVGFGLVQSGVSYGRVYTFGSTDADGDYSATSDALGSAEGDDDRYQYYYGYHINPFPVDLDKDGNHDFIASDYGFAASSGIDTNAGALFMTYQLD